MSKKIHVNIERDIKEELQRKHSSTHQMIVGSNGQYVDAHFDMDRTQLEQLGIRQVEVLLQLQVDSDTLRTIENVESENEVLDRIQWGKKKKVYDIPV